MRVITIAARKGGVGKSTMATHLSVLAAEGEKPVLLLDIDPQRSLTWWWKNREASTPALIECEVRELPKIIAAARDEGVAAIIIDTPPHAENSISEAMRAADLILIPTRPGPFDLAGVAGTLDLVKRIGRPALAVINHAPPRTGSTEPGIVTEAREALVGMGATVANTVIAQRVAFSHAVISGSTVTEYEPDGKASAELRSLWTEIETRLPE